MRGAADGLVQDVIAGGPRCNEHGEPVLISMQDSKGGSQLTPPGRVSRSGRCFRKDGQQETGRIDDLECSALPLGVLRL
jgi:hypothetical protein